MENLSGSWPICMVSAGKTGADWDSAPEKAGTLLMWILFADQVADGHNGVKENHPRAGIAHYFLYSMPHIWAIAMYFTLPATPFFVTKRAMPETLLCVCRQFGAIVT